MVEDLNGKILQKMERVDAVPKVAWHAGFPPEAEAALPVIGDA